MSIRKEHLDVFDKSLSSLQENADLAKQLVLDKGSIEKKIETGFNLIGGLGQSYQGVQTIKALFNKGTNTAKTATKALQGGKEEAKTTDTGSEETPTSEPDANVARTDPIEDVSAPLEDLPEPTMIDAGATPLLDSLPQEEIAMRMIEAAGITQRRAAAQALPDLPGLTEGETLDQLAPMRAMMAQRATPLNNSEAQQRILDFDPDQNISQVGNLSTEGSTRVLSGVENTVDEAGNALESGISDVSTTLTSGLSTAGDVAEGLAGVAAGSLDIPVAGEVIALFAGIGSAIAGAIGGETPKPTVVQTGADFSTTDEHSGNALSAY
tara:strand:- start:116 stop:1087 length:972 start_codon:yes stop_codon:yes gene_type:complete